MLLPFTLPSAGPELLNDLHIAVVVAVAVMLMVKVAFNQVIRVIAMRNRFVTAICSMNVLRIMTAAGMPVGAVAGIGGAYLNRMLVNVAIMHVVKMTIMQKVGMAIVLNLGVTAIGTVFVGVVFMDYVGSAHCEYSFQS